MTQIATDSSALESLLEVERGKARKLEIVFGPWWRHYAVPYEFRWTLYTAQSACPYCGGPLGCFPGDSANADPPSLPAHLDHMDPISRGGEDSLRNAVYVCATCNLAKRNRLFVDWLETLMPIHREQARAVYEEKHGQPPERFKPGRKRARLTLPRLELLLDEAVLRRLFPKPIVSGPPSALEV